MNKTYYIFRHRVGVPRHLDVCLADEKNGSNFIFQTKDAAQRCPQKDHGDGDPFLNELEGIISHSDSIGEAGLLTVLTTMAECNAEK